MAKTRFRGFSVKKQDFQELNCKKPRAKKITIINQRFIA
jgi:hypothetical protein